MQGELLVSQMKQTYPSKKDKAAYAVLKPRLGSAHISYLFNLATIPAYISLVLHSLTVLTSKASFAYLLCLS